MTGECVLREDRDPPVRVLQIRRFAMASKSGGSSKNPPSIKLRLPVNLDMLKKKAAAAKGEKVNNRICFGYTNTLYYTVYTKIFLLTESVSCK